MVKCTDCGKLACYSGELDNIPTKGYCPMQTHKEVLEKARKQYDEQEIRRVSQESARVEAIGYCQWTRVQETMEFATRMGFQKLGIAYCIGLRREARTLADIYRENGFEVVSVCCKSGSIPKEDIGLRDDEKIRPGTYESVCNPIGQAMVMNAEKTDLNVIIGLCVGHDSLFIRHSKALVTCLVAKDRVLAHNPVGAIYTAKTYYRKKLFEKE
ncbi:MAG: hypothetical protein ThorAB25_15790 [Candidatus Thorarchaeota archaeon AB_25]|nr:MAG: hypothetical protein ThorAB25_15790 [Candidatus Thorarchaeota archaeon AB_25]